MYIMIYPYHMKCGLLVQAVLDDEHHVSNLLKNIYDFRVSW
jgi:hypothetical protein